MCLRCLSCWQGISGQRRCEFTCYIKLVRTARVVPNKASLSFTLGNVIWSCSEQYQPSVGEGISAGLDIHYLENKVFLLSCSAEQILQNRKSLYFFSMHTSNKTFFFISFCQKASIDFSFYSNFSTVFSPVIKISIQKFSVLYLGYGHRLDGSYPVMSAVSA